MSPAVKSNSCQTESVADSNAGEVKTKKGTGRKGDRTGEKWAENKQSEMGSGPKKRWLVRNGPTMNGLGREIEGLRIGETANKDS